jgi:hypothetical protein
MLHFLMLIPLHNELGIARYLNHLYDSDMSVILPPKTKSRQALKTLRFDGSFMFALIHGEQA